VAKGKKKTKQWSKGGAKQQQPRQVEQQRGMSKVRCFACNQLGHYVGQCPKKKKKKLGGTTTTTEEEEFVVQFESECSLIVCCSTVEIPSNIWYIDSGASSHMSGVREHFTLLLKIQRSGWR
jgi:hypothetical protein